MKLAFYISGKSTRLRKFLTQANNEQLNRIKLVYSDDAIDEQLRLLLSSLNVQLIEVNYKSLPGNTTKEKNKVLSEKMLSAFLDLSIDYCISFGSHILTEELLKIYENRIINFHPSILPLFPGLNALDQAKEYGNVFLVGNTAHFMDLGVDSGPIIMQSVTTMRVFAAENDYDLVLDLQIPMLNKVLEALINNDIEINDKQVIIKNADYSISHIYPEY